MGKILFLLHSRRSQISGSGETCLSPCGLLVEWPGFKPRTKKNSKDRVISAPENRLYWMPWRKYILHRLGTASARVLQEMESTGYFLCLSVSLSLSFSHTLIFFKESAHTVMDGGCRF